MTLIFALLSFVTAWDGLQPAVAQAGGSAPDAQPQAAADAPDGDAPPARRVSPHRLFDDAREAFMAGYYREAYTRFGEISGAPGLAVKTAIAMADCQMQWGDYAGARATLGDTPPQGRLAAEWRRAAAAVAGLLGDYEQAIEHGEQALASNPDAMRARYELGRMYEWLGRRDQAEQTYRYFNDLLTTRFPTDPEELHYAGLGLYRYSVLTRHPNLADRTKYVLQEVLQKACMVIDLTYWPARLAIADLLAEKYQYEEAEGDYRAVLERNPNSTAAHLGLAAIALEGWDFETVEAQVAAALDINPNSCEAYVLLAALRMLERRPEEAAAAARRGLAINPQHLHALSYLAAAQLRCGEPEASRQTQAAVYAINPQPAVLHAVLGKQLSDGRQFAEAEVELQKAIEFDPTDPAPRNELGMMYMQWGREDKARGVLDAAFRLDAFNARTFNTLDLLEELEGFAKHHTEHFEIHYDAGSDAVLSSYFADYLEGIYDELVEDYGIALEETTVIEVFPDHRKFGVRIHGKPWIHTVGACTGRVIAMDAPRRDVSGPYNYADVLRHEFTHTVTLAATRNRIPHWFTEGLAVLQEDKPKGWNWRTFLAERLRRNELFPLRDIDWGFMRPRRANDRQVAYAQSEWMCEFLVATRGYEIINKMLAGFREGRTQRDILAELTGWTPEEFDAAFQAWAREDAAGWGLPLDPPTPHWALTLLTAAYPDNAELLARRAELLLEDGDIDGALAAAEQALNVDPQNRRALATTAQGLWRLAPESPSREQAQAYFEQAAELSRTLAEHHPDDPLAPEYLALWEQQKDNSEEAARWARTLKALQPLNPVSYRVLSGVYLAADDDQNALPELLELARHEDQDPDVPRQIARIYREQDKPRAAADWYRTAIHIDPYDPGIHEAYAAVLSQLGEYPAAIEEHHALTLLQPANARRHSDLAFAYFRAGERDSAQAAARKAVELDPASPARQLLSE